MVPRKSLHVAAVSSTAVVIILVTLLPFATGMASWNFGDEVTYFEPSYFLVKDGRYACPSQVGLISRPDLACFLQPPLWSYWLLPFVLVSGDAIFYAVRLAQAALIALWVALYFRTFGSWTNSREVFRPSILDYAVVSGIIVVYTAQSITGRMDILGGVLLLGLAFMLRDASQHPMLIGALLGLCVAVHPLTGLVAATSVLTVVLLEARDKKVQQLISYLMQVWVIALLTAIALWAPLVLIGGFDNWATQFTENVRRSVLRGGISGRTQMILQTPLYVAPVVLFALTWARLRNSGSNLSYASVLWIQAIVGAVFVIALTQPSYQYMVVFYPVLSALSAATYVAIRRSDFVSLRLAGMAAAGVVALVMVGNFGEVLSRAAESLVNPPDRRTMGLETPIRVNPKAQVLADSKWYYSLRPQAPNLYDLEYYCAAFGGDPNRFASFDLIVLRETPGRSRWFYVPDVVRSFVEQNFVAEEYNQNTQRLRLRSLTWRQETEVMAVYRRKQIPLTDAAL